MSAHSASPRVNRHHPKASRAIPRPRTCEVDVIIPWRSSLEAGRGGAAVTTWIFRGGGDGCKGVSQRRRFRRGRGYTASTPRNAGCAPTLSAASGPSTQKPARPLEPCVWSRAAACRRQSPSTLKCKHANFGPRAARKADASAAALVLIFALNRNARRASRRRGNSSNRLSIVVWP